MPSVHLTVSLGNLTGAALISHQIVIIIIKLDVGLRESCDYDLFSGGFLSLQEVKYCLFIFFKAGTDLQGFRVFFNTSSVKIHIKCNKSAVYEILFAAFFFHIHIPLTYLEFLSCQKISR